MRSHMWTGSWIVVACLMTTVTQNTIRAETSPADTAKRIIETSGVRGGLVVHVGCGDGRLTAALRLSDAYLVQGLDSDARHIDAARDHIRSAALYGPVSVDRIEGEQLPLVDDSVNLVVLGAQMSPEHPEVHRVLCPGGVAVTTTLEKRQKPRPPEIGDWTHYLHGPDNNAVTPDTAIGPPRRLQWQGGPKWTRHHDHMSSLSALVSSGGKLFYIMDEGSMASIYLPSHWGLIARDAFNGKILWRRPIENWFTRFKGLKDGPADAPRRLVASGDRVYAALSLDGPVVALDATNGDTIRTYDTTRGAEEILLSDGALFVLVGPGSIGDGGRLVRPAETRKIMALDADSGRTLWEANDVVAATTLAVDDGRAYYFNFARGTVVGLDRRTGKRLWVSTPLPAPDKQTSFFAQKLVVARGVVLLASGEKSGMTKSGGGERKADTLTALAADTGKILWTAPHSPSGYSSPENLFVIGDTVWFDDSSSGQSDGTVTALDLATGAERHSFAADRSNYWFHHRCYPGRATTRYLMTSRTGIEFIDLQERRWDLNHWVRGACLYGIMPANGLIYTPPAPCICYAESMLHSFNAFAPATRTGRAWAPVAAEARLERGPVFAEPIRGTVGEGDWPTYRADNARSGSATTAVSSELRAGWKADIGGRLSSPVIAEGSVLVSAVDRHTIFSLDAATGKTRWQFTAGGRVDSPPTSFEGRVLFGCADGRIYCLRASDGALVWRFLAAPADRRIVSYEQVESVWPIHGSVLVRDGIVHCVAGRSLFVDGGMRLMRLDARTGALVSETVLDERSPDGGEDVQGLVKWLNMPVGRPDILSCDDRHLYMRSQSFDFDGRRLQMGPVIDGPEEGARQGGERTHLFCPTGFLDDSWFHRTYWLYGKTWGSGWNGYFVNGQFAPAGKIMCVGDERVFAFDRQPQYYRWTTPLEYRLYAAKKEWKPATSLALADDEKVAAKSTKKGKGKPKGKTKQAAKSPGPVENPGNYAWTTEVPILVRAMTLAGPTLFIAGPPDILDESSLGKQPADETLATRQEAALAGNGGALLWAVAAKDGARLAEFPLDAPPIFDGMAAAGGHLYLSDMGGKVVCLKPAR